MESSFCSMQQTVVGLGFHELGPIPISPLVTDESQQRKKLKEKKNTKKTNKQKKN